MATSEAEVTKASGNQHAPKEMTVERLYRLIHGRQTGHRHTGKYAGDCLSCGEEPAVKAGQCRKCAAWHNQWLWRGLKILAHKDGRIVPDDLVDVVYNGPQDVWKVSLTDGKSITATADHRHLTERGWVEVRDLTTADKLIVMGEREVFATPQSSGNPPHVRNGLHLLRREIKALGACEVCGSSDGRLEIAHLDSDRKNNDRGNLKLMCQRCHKEHDYRTGSRKVRWSRGRLTEAVSIESIEHVGVKDTYDVCMKGDDHSWVGNGIVTHNSHATAYGLLSYRMAWLKAHHPTEFMAALLETWAGTDKEPKYIAEARKMHLTIHRPDVNGSTAGWTIEGTSGLRRGFRSIHGIGETGAQALEELAPYESIEDLCERVPGHAVPGSKKFLAKRTRGEFAGALLALRQSGALKSLGVEKED